MGINKIRKTIIAVPVRLESSRLPKKVLEDINGKPMLIRVLEQCKKVKIPAEIVLFTDSQLLSELAKSIGINSYLTNKNCKSGSERIASVVSKLVKNSWKDFESNNKINDSAKLKETLVINVQADQPFLDPDVLKKMYEFFLNQKETPEVVTPIYKLKKNDIHNTSVVKTLLNQDLKAIYFSRSPIPYIRDINKNDWHLYYDYWGHVGIYGYRADILSNWNKYPSSMLEKCEKLEQLKLIDAGVKVSTFEVKGNFLSVDTKEDLLTAREWSKN
tara:strand:- start:1666 stop:2484 length:819 start_codon:yes stop_codon:yes gene_type:complete